MEITKSQIMQIDSILQITCLPSEEHSMDVLARRQPWGQVPTYCNQGKLQVVNNRRDGVVVTGLGSNMSGY